jgi:hypothetical protein
MLPWDGDSTDSDSNDSIPLEDDEEVDNGDDITDTDNGDDTGTCAPAGPEDDCTLDVVDDSFAGEGIPKAPVTCNMPFNDLQVHPSHLSSRLPLPSLMPHLPSQLPLCQLPPNAFGIVSSLEVSCNIAVLSVESALEIRHRVTVASNVTALVPEQAARTARPYWMTTKTSADGDPSKHRIAVDRVAESHICHTASLTTATSMNSKRDEPSITPSRRPFWMSGKHATYYPRTGSAVIVCALVLP